MNKKPVERVIYDNYNLLDDLYESAMETLIGYNNEEDISEDDIWNEVYNIDALNFDDEYSALKEYFEGKDLIVFGSIGRWDGTRTGFKIFESFENAFHWMTKDCEFIKIYDENGHLRVRCSHHDGSNEFEIKILKDSGKNYIDNWEYAFEDKRKTSDILKQVIKKHSLLPNYLHDVFGTKKIEYALI